MRLRRGQGWEAGDEPGNCRRASLLTRMKGGYGIKPPGNGLSGARPPALHSVALQQLSRGAPEFPALTLPRSMCRAADPVWAKEPKKSKLRAGMGFRVESAGEQRRAR
jgi:hypothetical protein